MGFYPRILELFYRRPENFSLSGEVLAGVSVGLIALPLSLALGIASIPAGCETMSPAPSLGIFTAIIAGCIVSLLGGSRVQIGGPTAAFIPIILLIIIEYGYVNLLLATMMAGVFLVVMGFTRMGTLIKFIPWPVTSGFTTGIAVAIMLTQVPDFLGIQSDQPVPDHFFDRLQWLMQEIGHANVYAVGLSVLCVGIVLFWPKLKIKMVPGSVVAMLIISVLVAILNWDDVHGVATIGSKFGEGAIPSSLPKPSIPTIDLANIRNLLGPAMAIALLGAIESLLSAVVSDGMTGDRHDSNSELIAQGIANIICPLFGGLPATGAIARTSANVNSGGKTPLAGIFHSITLLGIVLLASKWAVYIPMAALSALLVTVAMRMGEWQELFHIRKMAVSDALVLVTTFALTVIFDLVVAVEVGMVLAAILFIKRVSETTEVSQVTEDDFLETPEQMAKGKKIPDGVMVYRIFGPFLFGAADKMHHALERVETMPKILVLRLQLVTVMDATGMNALENLIERCRKRNCTLVISGIHRQPLQMMKRGELISKIGNENFCATFDNALLRANELLK